LKPPADSEIADWLFDGERHGFQFGMRRTAGDAWFQLEGWDASALAERRGWIADQPGAAIVWLPEAGPVLAEAADLFGRVPLPPAGAEACAELGRLWEPDFLLLRRDDGGTEFRLVGGAVCFASAWDVREKIGLSVTQIHGVVPTLNRDFEARIRTFLDRMPAGAVFERQNWGLAAHGHRNAHPALGHPRLHAGSVVADTWLRIEHQAFRSLPASRGVLFAIRVTVHPLRAVVALARAALAAQLDSMDPDVAAYKGIAAARESLLRSLRAMD
jgi:dimethylamine monooxygenase subunit A